MRAACRLGLLAFAVVSSAQASEVTTVLNRRLAPNQTLGAALHATGLSDPQVDAVIAALQGVFDFRRARPGDQLRLVLRGEVLDQFDLRQNAVDEWQVRRDGDRLVGEKRAVQVQRLVETVDLEVASSLYEAAVAAGEDPLIAMTLSDVFAWDIDFYQDVRKGDRARAVLEKFVSPNGRLLRYGEVLAATYVGEAVGQKKIFRFQLPDGSSSFFQEDGSSARKTFLKSPLKYAHVTSRFGRRFHPVLQYLKAHNGVDYGTPVGTPVWAVADGTVTRAGWDGPGGNTVCLRHGNGLETCYLHLSRFGPGIRAGARVVQKQVIAYSGNTGRSTGPHLHFALKRGGRFVNPLNQNFPRAEPLPEALRPDFAAAIQPWVEQLQGSAVASGRADNAAAGSSSVLHRVTEPVQGAAVPAALSTP